MKHVNGAFVHIVARVAGGCTTQLCVMRVFTEKTYGRFIRQTLKSFALLKKFHKYAQEVR